MLAGEFTKDKNVLLFPWSSFCYGRCKADIHRMSCTLVFALIRIRKH